jgi:hypothetical protein
MAGPSDGKQALTELATLPNPRFDSLEESMISA